MTCHYLEEDHYQKICRAKGILPPSYTELRQYCYNNAYICPVYKKYIEKAAIRQIDLEEKNKQDHLDEHQDERLDHLY